MATLKNSGIKKGTEAALTKAEQTKQKILETALDLFLKEGYERATMREIARKAGLSQGAAYYYFPSKEHIIHFYYQDSHRKQFEQSRAVLEKETTLERRLAGAVHAHLEVAQPYHSISRALFKTAADPSHPISPFSIESRELRDENIQFFDDLVGGSTTSLVGLPRKLRERLPELLWMYKMGIILYWVHDNSQNQEKTFKLIDVSAGLIAGILKASKIPGISTLVNKGVDLFDQFKTYE
jgi:AcrR family transcriptional regulator